MVEREGKGKTEGAQETEAARNAERARRAEEAHPDPDPDIYRRGSWQQRPEPLGGWLRLATAGAAAIVLGLGALSAIEALGQVLAVVFLGVTIAAALNPIANRLEQLRIPRALAVIAIYIVLVGIIVLIGFLIVPSLAEQVRQLVAAAPDALDAVESWLNRQRWLMTMLGVEHMDELEPFEGLITGLASLALALLTVPGAIVTIIAEFLLMIFVSIYTLILARQLTLYVASLFPREQGVSVLSALYQITSAMGGYLRGLLIDASILATVTYVGLLVIGVNFPLLLGVVAGLGEIIPIAGPVIAGSLIVLVALFQSPQRALITLIFVLILQQFESNVLVPIVMKSQVHISPLFTLVAIAIGGTVGGLLGAVVAVPVAAAVTALVRVAIAPAIRRKTGAPPQEE